MQAFSQCDIRLTRSLAEGAQILQINMLDHVIIGRPYNSQQGYFSFKEAGLSEKFRCTRPSPVELPRACETRSLFALALSMHQTHAQNVFSVGLDQRNLVLAKPL